MPVLVFCKLASHTACADAEARGMVEQHAAHHHANGVGKITWDKPGTNNEQVDFKGM